MFGKSKNNSGWFSKSKEENSDKQRISVVIKAEERTLTYEFFFPREEKNAQKEIPAINDQFIKNLKSTATQESFLRNLICKPSRDMQEVQVNIKFTHRKDVRFTFPYPKNNCNGRMDDFDKTLSKMFMERLMSAAIYKYPGNDFKGLFGFIFG